MSLDFCCNIQMVGSGFGVKIMKAWIHPALSQQFRLVVVVLIVWGIFSWRTLGPWVPIEHRWNTTAYLSIVTDHVHPFMTTVYPSSDATSSRIMHRVTKIKSSQTGFLNMTMSSLYSNGLHSHEISINRAHLGCGGTGDSHHGCAADKSAATAWCYHINMDQNLGGMFTTPCWIYATKN